jgi:6-phosphogluconolactonase/glucosamine-6-phosphate isomerase/deaminase
MRRVSGFALDEYIGIAASDERSYTATIDREVTTPLGLNPERVHVPKGDTQDHREAADCYEAEIKSAGGIDVQILGIGTHGHLGFNEPGSSLASRTRIKTLSHQTRTLHNPRPGNHHGCSAFTAIRTGSCKGRGHSLGPGRSCFKPMPGLGYPVASIRDGVCR